jgi:lipopolysaccharide heptosyltransferase I
MKHKNILIIKPSSFGDVIQAMPVAAALKSLCPETRVCWLVNAQYKRLLENSACIDRVFVFDREAWKTKRNILKAALSFAGLCRTLRKERFDAVIDLQGLFRSGLISLLSGAGIKCGFKNAREFAHLFYNRAVSMPDQDTHSVERYLLTLRNLGFRGREVEFPLGIGKDERDWAAGFLKREGAVGKHIAGLSPFARWPTKKWPADRFARLGDSLAGSGASVIIIGGSPGEGKEITRRMARPAVDISGTTDPLRLAALLERLDVLVTNDTGPMHLAAAVGTPIVALFGPTSPARTGPYGKGHKIITAPVDCHPCYRKRCEKSPACMSRIEIETVKSSVDGILARRAKQA